MTKFDEDVNNIFKDFDEAIVEAHNEIVDYAWESNTRRLSLIYTGKTNKTERSGEALNHLKLWEARATHPELAQVISDKFNPLFDKLMSELNTLLIENPDEGDAYRTRNGENYRKRPSEYIYNNLRLADGLDWVNLCERRAQRNKQN